MTNRYIVVIAACGLARTANAAPYGSQDFVRNAQVYQQRMAEQIYQNNRPVEPYKWPTSPYSSSSSSSTSSSRYAPRNSYTPRAKTYNERLVDSYNAKVAAADADSSKPAPYPANRSKLADFYAGHGFDYFQALNRADGDIQDAQRNEEEARARTNERERQLGEARWQKHLAEKAAQKAAVEARAAGGDATAMGELAAYWDRGDGDAVRLARYERAANAGDAMSLSYLYDRYRSGDGKDEAKARLWLDKMAEVGDERGALLIADELMAREKPDFDAAVGILRKAFIANSSPKAAARLSTIHSAQAATQPKYVANALAWARMMLEREGEKRFFYPLQVIDKIPVTEQSAPQIVEMLTTIANRMNDKSDAAHAAFRLAQIYAGEGEEWRGLVSRRPDKSASMYEHAAMHNSNYVGPAAQYFFRQGNVAQAERLFEDAKKKDGSYDRVAWYQAAQFWLERTDGKADGFKAIEFYLLLDKNGSDVADDIGDMYRLGKAIPKDEAKAVEWYRYGFKKNQELAARRLGLCLFKGIGTPRDEAEALTVLESVANWSGFGGNSEVERRQIAFDVVLYRFIQMVRDSKDIQTVLEGNGWRFLDLAEKGEPLAQEFVGAMLVNGYWKRDGDSLADGWKWIEKAKASEPRAQVLWAIHLLGAADPKRAPREDRDVQWGGKPENRAEAVRLLLSAAEKDQPNAGLMLGYCYQYGWGVEKNEAEAIRWFEWGHKRGEIEVLRPLFDLQIDSRDPQVVARGAAAAEEAANVGRKAWAQNAYGVLLFKGQGVKQNAPLALEYLDKAAAQGEWMAARSAAKIRMIGAPYLPAEGAAALKALEDYSAKSSDGALKMAQLYAGEAAVNPWFAPDLGKAQLWIDKVQTLCAAQKKTAAGDSPQY